MTPIELQKRFKIQTLQLALFCMEYVHDLNASKAMLRADYPESSARNPGRMFTRKGVLDAIAFLQKESGERLEYNADSIRKDLIDMKEMSIADIFNDNWQLRPISEWPDIWLKSVSAIEVIELRNAKDEKDVEDILKKVKWPDPLKVMELLGKHNDIQAWREIHKIEEDSIVERMNRAKEREENATPTKH